MAAWAAPAPVQLYFKRHPPESKTEKDSFALDWRMGCGTPNTQKGIEKFMGWVTQVPLV